MTIKSIKPRNRLTYKATTLPDVGFVRLPTVLSVLGVSKNAFLNGAKSGVYPSGKLLSPRTRVYSVDEIRALIDKINVGDVA